MKFISERNEHVRIDNGYCVICGNFSKLKKDHVPPQCASKPSPMLQKTIFEYFSNAHVPPIKAKNGTTFRTICHDCNSQLLGSMDAEIGRVTSEFIKKLNDYFVGKFFHHNYISFEFDAYKFLRAMIGHLLAATSVKDCMLPIVDSPFYTPLRSFVLGKNLDIDTTHNIYYWFYPFKRQITAQSVGFFNDGHFCICSCLHFFPISFMVTLKEQGTYPVHATEMKLSDNYLHFNMTTANIDYASFPFVSLKGNQMSMLSSGHTCVSYTK
ncbi:chaperonin [Citrobacter freundii]|uniref:chaperonin n=1 Tax=Citrobacter freundii TaxID=546 RepID=UPI00333D33A2|nr:chaperonin [Citrobacter freundii]